MTLAGAAAVYLAVGFGLWVHAWTQGATTHTLCGCGDPALFLWFFQWPATALAHGQNPFFSTALFHPTGVNLLAQTSVTGLSIPLVPVTWIWGPVASLNVASTITPALTAFTAFVVIRRWAPWTPAAFIGGLLYGFSPFVLSSLEFAHLMTAALMLLPLILGVLDEILIRQRHSALGAGVLLGAARLRAVLPLLRDAGHRGGRRRHLPRGAGDRRAGEWAGRRCGARAPHAAKALGVGLGVGVVLLAWPVWFALKGPAHLSGLVWPNVGVIGGFIPSSFVTTTYPPRANVFLALGGYEGAPLASSAYIGWSFLVVMAAGLAVFWRDRRLWFFGFMFAVCVVFSLGERHGQWEPAWIFTKIPVLENIIEQRFMAIGYLAAAVMLAIILEHVHRAVPDWRGALGALAVAGVALAPMAVIFGERLPFAMQAGHAATLVHRGGPDPAPGPGAPVVPGAVLGAAVRHDVAGRQPDALQPGRRRGTAGGSAPGRLGEPGFHVLSLLDFGVGDARATGTPAQYAAVRHTLWMWQVTTVVIATEPGAPPDASRGTTRSTPRPS